MSAGVLPAEAVTALGWIGTGSAILGALIVALKLGERETGLGFVVFLVSSSSWVVAGALEGITALVVQNGVLTAINVVAIWRWLLAKG